MYNLSHLYFYENEIDSNIETIIDLLLKSGFPLSYELLCIVLIKKYGTITKETIINEINSHEFSTNDYKKFISNFIYLYIKGNNLEYENNYINTYNRLKNNDYMYDTKFQPILSYLLMKDHEEENKIKITNLTNIDTNFYEGFGIS